jgi:hypothetical protein
MGLPRLMLSEAAKKEHTTKVEEITEDSAASAVVGLVMTIVSKQNFRFDCKGLQEAGRCWACKSLEEEICQNYVHSQGV